MPMYRILPGGSFRQPDGSLLTAGADIDLATDVAAMHPGKVDLLPEAAPDAAPAEPPADQPA